VLSCAAVRHCYSQRRVVRRIALTRGELAYLEAAAVRAGLSLEAFVERLLVAYLANSFGSRF
jgi:hypothetical protein